MSEFVLDSSAVLAYILDKRGADIVHEALPGAWLSSVNLAEVVGKLRERGMPLAEIERALAPVDFELVDFGAELAMICGDMRVLTRPLGLSLGDRACLALARQRDATALTTDEAWAKVPGAKVRLLR